MMANRCNFIFEMRKALGVSSRMPLLKYLRSQLPLQGGLQNSTWGAPATAGFTTSSSSSSSTTTSDEQPKFFPRRSVMYVPACDERKTKKAASLKVDTIVYDIEDGVAANQKAAARKLAGAAVAHSRASGCGPHQELVVRVNGLESGLMEEDLEAVLGQLYARVDGSIPDSIMLPKCDSVEHLRQLDVILALYRSRLPRPFLLHVLLESPTALINLRDIFSFGKHAAKNFTLSCAIFGSDDYLAAIGGTRTKSAHELLVARQTVVSHARAFGMDAIDLVDIDYKDLESLRAQAEEGARMGFTGKQVIHPSQVPVVDAAFSPSPQQLEWATGLCHAFKEHQISGKGAFVYRGAAIDRPLLLQAENIVRLHQEILQQQ